MPGFAAWSHESQVPSQAELQHTPSTQKPLAQSLAFAQTAPLVFAAGMVQVPPKHVNPVAQSASVVHIVGQLVFVPSQRSGAQSPFVGAMPACSGVHVPDAQVEQEPAQAVSQQMPSAQKPDAHPALLAHDDPVGPGVQVPSLAQTLPVAQSAVLVQCVRHALPLELQS